MGLWSSHFAAACTQIAMVVSGRPGEGFELALTEPLGTGMFVTNVVVAGIILVTPQVGVAHSVWIILVIPQVGVAHTVGFGTPSCGNNHG